IPDFVYIVGGDSHGGIPVYGAEFVARWCGGGWGVVGSVVPTGDEPGCCPSGRKLAGTLSAGSPRRLEGIRRVCPLFAGKLYNTILDTFNGEEDAASY
ncbi:MAG: hypothetical protein QXT73_06560, partial [Candidatus Methanomethylicaceae archaeon]